MKLSAPLLLVAALGLVSCAKEPKLHDFNPREMYAPTPARGPYSQALEDGTWKQGVKPTPTPPDHAPKTGKGKASSAH